MRSQCTKGAHELLARSEAGATHRQLATDLGVGRYVIAARLAEARQQQDES